MSTTYGDKVRPRGAVRRAAGAVVAAAALASCSADGQPPDTAPTVDRSDPSNQSATAGTPTPSSPAPATTEPLVLVAHHSRGELRISASVARRVEARRVARWSSLDGTDDVLRVVRSVAGVTRDRDAVALVPASRVRPWVRAAVVDGVDPLRRPAAYPIRTAGPDPARVTTLTVVGDIMLDRGVTAAAPPGDPTAGLRPMRGLLAGADLTVGNLESTLSEDGEPRQPGDDSFAADPAVLPALAELGIDAVSLANNHTGDYGTPALLESVAAFRGTGLRAFGAGRDLAAAGRPLVLRSHGVSFGFVGFNAIGETLPAAPGQPGALSVRMPPRTGPLDRGDLRHVLGIVEELETRVDVVVVLPHWGEQYTHVAAPIQSYVARRLGDAGADLVAGGHPHWVQGLERTGDAVVAHSLGNYLFDMDFMEQTMEGVALTATFWGDRMMGVELTPYRLDPSYAPRPAAGDLASNILGDVWTNSFGPFRSP